MLASIACRSARLWERSAAACSSAACSSCQLGERTYSSEPATAPGVRLSPTAPWPAPSDLERTTTARRPLEGVRGADFVAQGTAILDAGLLASTGGRGGTHQSRSGGKKRRLEERWFRNLSNASGAMRGSERARWRQKGKFAHLMTSLETALGAARALRRRRSAGAARTVKRGSRTSRWQSRSNNEARRELWAARRDEAGAARETLARAGAAKSKDSRAICMRVLATPPTG